ncbi:nose resistant to fluoxetine protein 6-like [Galleria mellonella]|uniref:Nose resistant to fluoxetine protein 6-like n=1 Tax=Galleria mellonella TaxID=7137 RepID=A0A6J3BZ79_GALME|nr:nose resistant to fluoxetine protein 6-like [Galleria mellonella]
MGVLVLLFLCVFHGTSGVIYRLNEEEYKRMPPIFRMDPYNSCLQHPSGLYCSVDMTLVSDEPSELLTMIQEYSAHTAKHFNHTRLRYYVCVTDTCNTFYSDDADLTASVERCFNDTLWSEYRLKSKISDSDVILCDRQGESVVISNGELLVAFVITSLIVLNATGTLYGALYVSKKIPENKFLLSFSVPDNWKQLVTPTSYKNQFAARLRGLNGWRSIFMMFVIMAHVILPTVVSLENVHHYEQMYDNLGYHIFFNGGLIIQIFFAISGLLLVYNLLSYSEHNELTWMCLPRGVILRWLRITPPYAIVLAFTATWLRYVGSGPLWKKVVETEVNACQQDWWYHILMINNYIDHSECMPQTWYLAADMQLHILGMIVFIMIKSDRNKKLAMYMMLFMGLMLPPLHTYLQDLNGTLLVSPEVLTTVFKSDPTFNNVYKRGHTNMASFAMGMLTGYYIYYWQRHGFDINKYKKYRIIYWMLIPLDIVIILLATLFYQDRPTASILVRTAYAAVMKPLFSIAVVLLLIGMIFKLENIYRGMFEWSGWNPVARLSYCAYLIHMLPIRWLGGLKTELTYVSFSQMINNSFMIQCITLIAAVPFWLLVERPITRVINHYTSSNKNKVAAKAA